MSRSALSRLARCRMKMRSQWRTARFFLLVSVLLTVISVEKVGALATHISHEWEAPDGRRWYVSATAKPGGDGTREKPFNTLMQAQAWSAARDTIVILASPVTTPPLDDGIWLKTGQTIIGEGPSITSQHPLEVAPRITNSTSFYNNGDAVVMADHTTVKNLVIISPYRAGIYASNVTGVRIIGNHISGHNQSCTAGIHIFPFRTLESRGIPNGWAGIMIDSWTGRGEAIIDGNIVRDATCGDGIDIRLAGSAAFDVAVTNNHIAHLLEGTKQGLRSVLAIGMQTGDISHLQAKIQHNTEVDIGSPGADPEGIFANVGGSSVADIEIDHNTADDIHGGPSANGMELVLMQRAARAHMKISNSTFTNITGDILEELTFGQDQMVRLELDHVMASHAVNPESPDLGLSEQQTFYNGASCFAISNTGPNFLEGGNNDVSVIVRNSSFTDCGVGIVAATRRSQMRTSLEIDGSNISGNRNANLYIKNADPITPEQSGTQNLRPYVVRSTPGSAQPPGAATAGRLGRLDVKVRNTKLNGAIRGPNVYVYAVHGTVLSGHVDLGTGSERGDAGRNDLSGTTRVMQISGVVVQAEGNWWGQPTAAGLIEISNGAAVTHGHPLSKAP